MTSETTATEPAGEQQTEDTPPTVLNGTVDNGEAAEVEDAAQDDAEAQDDEDGGNAEAIKWRRKLRAAEAERDQLAERVAAVQRRHAEALITQAGVKPDAVFMVADIGELVDQDGLVSVEKVNAAVATARERFNITTPKGNVVKGVGNQPQQRPKADRFTEAFKPRRGR